MAFASTNNHFRLAKRDGGESVVFSIAPDSITDTREQKQKGGSGSGEAEVISQIEILRTGTYGARKISFEAIFDRNFADAQTTPAQAAETLRQWQRPDTTNSESQFKKEPPVLVLTGYDIVEVQLWGLELTVEQYNPDIKNEIWLMKARLELAQYVSPESPERAWEGLGGSFSSQSSLGSEVRNRRLKRVGKAVTSALSDRLSEEQQNANIQQVAQLIKDGLISQDDIPGVIEADLASQVGADGTLKVGDTPITPADAAQQLTESFNQRLSQKPE